MGLKNYSVTPEHTRLPFYGSTMRLINYLLQPICKCLLVLGFNTNSKHEQCIYTRSKQYVVGKTYVKHKSLQTFTERPSKHS